MSKPISRTQAIEELSRYALPLTPEALTPADAVGLVAARDITAGCDVPEQASSLRDGYALKAADLTDAAVRPVTLEVVQAIHAESRDPDPIGPGQAARVLTGGPVPPGADAVLAEEDVDENLTGDTPSITVTTPVRPGCFIRPVGGEIPRDAVITEAGTVVTPQAAAVMLRSRLGSVPVHPRPTARIYALGSELVEPDVLDDPDRLPADNLLLTRGLLEASGVEVIESAVLPDDKQLLIDVLSSDDLPDIVVTSGGTGRSERDFARLGANASGFTILVDSIDMRPGRHMFVAKRGETILFSQPGPPAAVFTCFHGVILPLIRRMRGLSESPPLKARLTKPLNARPGSEWLVQCELAMDGSRLTATPLAGKGCPPLLGQAHALGLAIFRGGVTLNAGDEVEIITVTE